MLYNFFLSFFLLVSFSWAACHKVAQSWTCWSGGYVNGEWLCIKPTDTSRQIYDNCTSDCVYRGYGCGERRCDYYYCDTQLENDSLNCVINPSLPQCQCDSTFHCNTITETTQTTIATDGVECWGGECYGGVYCLYETTNTTDCSNGCGEFTTQTNTFPLRYDGACNPDNLLDDTECSKTRCMSFEKTNSYTLYKMCASREIINGERKFLPRFVGGGVGTCKNAGWAESNDSTLVQPDSTGVPDECFTMGINCPKPDTTNYEDAHNRNPDKCKCEKLDGLSHISSIVCPDGSRNIFYGSCDDWQQKYLSSSSAPPVSSGISSENPPASSGGAELAGNWVTYSQGEDIKNVLAVIANNTAQQPTINNVNTMNVALDDYTANISDSAASLIVPDSVYSPDLVIDTAGLKNALFHRVTEENTILDTLFVSSSKCPCFTFFQGHTANFQGHLSLPEIKFDFSNFHGFDLCHIIQVIVSALASVVAFFIGFAIFKNVSQ